MSHLSLALYDSLEIQGNVARLFWINRFGTSDIHCPVGERKKSKIKIAYISADFKNHPISFLTAELFEVHDRDRFEIIGVSVSASNDEMQQRVSKAFDHFLELHGRSDDEIVSLLRGLNIDIAIDLGGYTQDSRFGVFARRVAPIQMSYLGFLGTTGSDCIDYIIADSEIIPEASQKFYTEKIAYLPSYQVNDRKRKASDRIFTRSEFGIPENAFVYCCFNNNYKLMPEVFASWMNILERVENSVLLLYAENDAVRENLKKEAVKKGVDPGRLFFGERLSQIDYLARFKIADLFLDTAPYNAGTTASDALWMGVPVLTRQGETFACRVASSILRAIDLPELITHSVGEYEALACELGQNPEKMSLLKSKLMTNKATKALFDTPRFTRNLERLFEVALAKHLNGEKPSHI